MILQENTSENDNAAPLVSIVVAVLNAEGTLQRCMDSVANQTYARKELIIMDGGSTDGTLNILKANSARISYWESMPDRGIYHAWNKAIQRTQGNYICFLGADDYWLNDSRLDRLVQTSINARFPDLISGRIAMVDINGKTLEIKGNAWDSFKMKKWMVVAHPGMLHHKDLFRKFGLFSENYKIAGDYEFLLRCGEKVSSAFIDDVLVCMGGNGVSRKNVHLVFKETFVIQSTHKEIGYARACMNFFLAYLKYFARRFLCGN